MTKSTEIFFYDILNNISAAAAAVPADTLNTFRRQAIARFFTIFASKHSRGLDRITVETNPDARHAVYDLITSVNKNTANYDVFSQLISKAIGEAEMPFLPLASSAPAPMEMSRNDKSSEYNSVTTTLVEDNETNLSDQYDGQLKDFLIKRGLITPVSVNSEDSLLSQAELPPGTAYNNHSSNHTSAPSVSYNQTVCCDSCSKE